MSSTHPEAPASSGVTPSHPRRLSAKRRAIVEAATQVFLRHGFRDTSVDAVALEAGVAKQTIYNHFGDKDRLFGAVIRETLASVDAQTNASLGEALGESDDLNRDLRALATRLVHSALQDDVAALRRLLISESDRHPELLQQWSQNGQGLQRQLVLAIRRQTERGALDVPHPELAADQFTLLVGVEGLTRALYGLRKLPDADIEEIVDNGVAMWLRCYQPRTQEQ